jgi:hypothetical protein
MKTVNRLIVAAVFVAAFNFTANLAAHDAPLPPRLKADQKDRMIVAGTTADTLDRSVKSISPRGQQAQRELARVPGTGPSGIDLARANRSTLPPKLQELRREQGTRFELAPLK